MKLKLVCPCHFGLESILAFEARRIGGENIQSDNGRVSFEGDETLLADANLRLSTAERVLIELGSFRALTFDELFEGVSALPLEAFIGRKNAFPVKGYSLGSKLESVPACQSIVKKAAAKRLGSHYRVSWLEESGAPVQLQFSIMKNHAVIYLDSSGEGLHKRGYRRISNTAPIKETLAAGIADLARVRPDSRLIDPFCGSGTLLIEAALRAANRAPGQTRSFACESWGCFSPEIWKNARSRALSEIRTDCAFSACGYDNDPAAVELTNENAKKAGVEKYVRAELRAIEDFVPESGSITVCNPPYGERMLELHEAEELYRVAGKHFPADKENPCCIITPHERFEELFGKKAQRTRKLYNGMLQCRLYMYF